MLAELLVDLSAWTWHFLRDAPFRPREETVTESLLTEFSRRGRGDVLVRKSTVAEEHADGLDWAWAIRTSAGWVSALIQAKNIDGKRFGWYPELRKASASHQAIDLIHAAGMAQALPLYVFYNSEVSPFGPAGTAVRVEACGHGQLTRDLKSLPWLTDCSPVGITLAHAADVLNFAVGPPAANQHASNINQYSMPWECLVCPQWRSDGSQWHGWPAIRAVAAQLAVFLPSPDDQVNVRDLPPRPEWLTESPPRWAELVLEGIDPSSDDDVPAVSYFVVVNVNETVQ